LFFVPLEALPALFSEIFAMNATGQPLRLLFRKLDPFRKHEPVYSATVGDMQLSLRPFWITADLFVVNQWQLPGGHPRRRMLKHYKDTLESDNGQSLVVLLQDQPVLQADLFRLQRNDEFPMPVLPGDARLHFMAAPSAIARKSLFTAALQVCLSYFFSFEGAERVFTRLPAGAYALYPPIEPAGFAPLKGKYNEAGNGVLYCCMKTTAL